MSTRAKWAAWVAVIFGAGLGALVATAEAATFVAAGTPIVFSAGNKTAAGDWIESELPSIVKANLDKISCRQGFDKDGVLNGTFTCEACDIRAYSDSEWWAARVAGEPVGNTATVKKCFPFVPVQTAALQTLLVSWASPSISVLSEVYSWEMARTPGAPSRVTGVVNPIQVKSLANARALPAEGPGSILVPLQ